MSSHDLSVLDQFKWERQTAAGEWVRDRAADCLTKVGWARAFADRLREECGCRFVDFIDLFILPESPAHRQQLATIGYEPLAVDSHGPTFRHGGGMFPYVTLAPHHETDVGIKVESVADFASANQLTAVPSGEVGDLCRCVRAGAENGVNVYGIERHGVRGVERVMPKVEIEAQARALESFRIRRRVGDELACLAEASKRIDDAIALVGRDVACDFFFRAEREYWMRRNRAAQVQYARQEKLGLGWANHDHHTYRSSREHFPRLVALWEKLGLTCRERFYAGLEAGWGAQVMEQPVTGIITFNDVDMSPEELLGDFSHDGFSRHRDQLGTIGLWCGLHGEAVLQAGMHHLEAQFDHKLLTRQLESEAGIKTMKPFTSFDYLTQAFTEGERWKVAGDRIAALLDRRLITAEQAEQFRTVGAIGSHLENLERNDGFKGFNQKGVSEIIAATDPRRLTAQLANVGH